MIYWDEDSLHTLQLISSGIDDSLDFEMNKSSFRRIRRTEEYLDDALWDVHYSHYNDKMSEYNTWLCHSKSLINTVEKNPNFQFIKHVTDEASDQLNVVVQINGEQQVKPFTMLSPYQMNLVLYDLTKEIKEKESDLQQKENEIFELRNQVQENQYNSYDLMGGMEDSYELYNINNMDNGEPSNQIQNDVPQLIILHENLHNSDTNTNSNNIVINENPNNEIVSTISNLQIFCDFCKKNFKSASSLYNHKSQFHRYLTDPMFSYKCDHCDFVATTVKQKSNHQKKHKI